jgi:hypothetical protein
MRLPSLKEKIAAGNACNHGWGQLLSAASLLRVPFIPCWRCSVNAPHRSFTESTD